MSSRPEPFRIAVPPGVLEDLRERIARTRWSEDSPGVGWELGMSPEYLRALLAHWRDGFDWRAREEELNRLSQFRAAVDGIGIHFVHERGEGPRPMPLVLTHGWPSTFWEMSRLIPLLTRPSEHGGRAEDAFDVVAPSLPGCGFSDSGPAMTKTRIAALWASLMTDVLGYRRFGARGGDIGSGVTAWLGLDRPDVVAGIHVSDVLRPFLGPGPGSPPLTIAERRFLDEERAWMAAEGAYDHVQATKPSTLAAGLTDSPAGLAAWIVEKFRSWSDCGGDVERRFSKDDLLTNLTIYWATGTIASANRLYFDRDREPRFLGRGQRVEVPCAVTIFPADIDRPPREWGERAYRVERWTEMPRGGHFAAWEEPELLARDLRDFFRPLR